MKIAEKSKVALSYTLTVDGEVADFSPEGQPLEFITSMGMLLPAFEENIAGKEAGDSFAFTLDPQNGYGEVNPEALVELPKDIFMVDGQIVEEATKVGNVLPMGDSMGNRMMGTIKEVGEDTIKMDFNHPMAGKTLNFEGTIISVSEPTDQELDMLSNPGGCGCGCGEGEGGDCSEGSCGEGCNC